MGIIYVSPIIFGSGIYLLLAHPIWGALLILTAAVIPTTAYTTRVDLQKRTFDDYLFFLGLKLQRETGRFEFVNEIVISKGDHQYKAASRVSDRTVHFNDYTATLIYNNDRALDLLTETDKKKLIKKIRNLAKYLAVPVKDHAVAEPYEIDLARM
jgi:hypothetical protein